MQPEMVPECFIFEFSEIVEALSHLQGRPQYVSEGLGASQVCQKMVAALGPCGLGIVAIRGVPGVEELRAQLLPLAPQLAALPKSELLKILKKHGLGTDTPFKSGRRIATSFAGQCRFSDPVLADPIPSAASLAHSVLPLPERRKDGSRNEMPSNRQVAQSAPYDTFNCECLNCAYSVVRNCGEKGADAVQKIHESDVHHLCRGCALTSDGLSPFAEGTGTTAHCDASSGTHLPTPAGCEMEQVGDLFKDLGAKLVAVSALVARACDHVLGEPSRLEKVMSEAKTAKGRLIHYHPWEEPEGGDASVEYHREAGGRGSGAEGTEEALEGEKTVWQEWHYDFGLFTALTSPLYSWDCLGLKNVRGRGGGLHVLDPMLGSAVAMDIPQGCVGVQVGEAAQILSGGKLRAAAHYVQRGCGLAMSREMFVVFSQPHWDEVLVSPLRVEGSDLCSEKGVDEDGCMRHPTKANYVATDGECTRHPTKDVFARGLIPSLKNRWKEGVTFAEFSKETTKQYYGATRTSQYMPSTKKKYLKTLGLRSIAMPHQFLKSHVLTND